MAFDKTLPANSTKLRNAPTVLTDNFAAIEEADSSFKPYAINLQDRNPLAVANDPATISGSSIIYVKQDGSGNPELYSKDGSGNILQMTSGGLLGGPSTAIKGSTIRFGSSTRTNNQNAMVSAWAYVSSAGAVLAGNGIASVTHTASTGVYQLNFTASHMANSNYGVQVTPYRNSSTNIIAQVDIQVTYNTSSFTIRINERSGGSSRDAPFSVAVFGGRA